MFIEKNTNESLIINYFDTLRQLRYLDIKYLLYFAGVENNDKSKYEKGSKEEALYLQIYTKLERLYLIKHASTFEYFDFGPESSEESLRTELTKYGKDFVSFISDKFDLSVYEEIIKNRPEPEDVIPKLKVTE